MQIRVLGAADFDAVHRLFVELMGPVPVPSGTAGRTRYSEILAHPGTRILGADVGGDVDAMATLHILPNLSFGGRPYALVENVVTARCAQGRGLGRAVMQAIISAAWAADCYKIMLLTGHASGASGFYEKLGFDGKEKQAMCLRRVPTRQAASDQEGGPDRQNQH